MNEVVDTIAESMYVEHTIVPKFKVWKGQETNWHPMQDDVNGTTCLSTYNVRPYTKSVFPPC